MGRYKLISRKSRRVYILVNEVLVKDRSEIFNVIRFKVIGVGRRHNVEENGTVKLGEDEL